MRALGTKIAVLLYDHLEAKPNGLRIQKIADKLGKKKETIESAMYCKINRYLFEKSQKDSKGRWLYKLSTVGKNAVKEHKENIAAQKAASTPVATQTKDDQPINTTTNENDKPVETTPSGDAPTQPSAQ